MNFSHFFIRRPIFAGVLSMVIFIVGATTGLVVLGRIEGTHAATIFRRTVALPTRTEGYATKASGTKTFSIVRACSQESPKS